MDHEKETTATPDGLGECDNDSNPSGNLLATLLIAFIGGIICLVAFV